MEINIVFRIFEVKEFLRENSEESIIVVFRIFHFSFNILQRSIAREKDVSKSRENQNKILKNHQITTVHQFIRRLLTYSMSFIKSLIFNAIRNLKLKENFFFQNFFQK